VEEEVGGSLELPSETRREEPVVVVVDDDVV
jgi:hypothetical protein